MWPFVVLEGVGRFQSFTSNFPHSFQLLNTVVVTVFMVDFPHSFQLINTVSGNSVCGNRLFIKVFRQTGERNSSLVLIIPKLNLLPPWLH